MAFRQWKEDVEELLAAGSAPSHAPFASSLTAMFRRIAELRNTVEIAEILALGVMRKPYQAVSGRAKE